MSYTLFYNALTGAAAIGDITDKTVSTTKAFADGSFGMWTHIVQLPSTNVLPGPEKLFFYNKDTREAAIGIVDGKSFTTTKVFPRGSFDAWTHIAAVGSYLFFYNRNNGAGAIATTEPPRVKLEKPTTGKIVKPDITVLPKNLDISNNQNQLNQLGNLKVDVPPAAIEDPSFTTVTSYAQGSFGTWTHVVASGSYLFFYNQNTGAGSIMKIQDEALKTVKDIAKGAKASLSTIKNFGNGSFSPWTHIVGAAPYLFFYNQGNGAALIGKLSDAGLTTVKNFPQKSFGTWTHIIAGAELMTIEKGSSHKGPLGGQIGGTFHADGNALLFYNEKSGAGALGNLNNDDFKTSITFKDGSFGNWTSIAGTSVTSDPYAFGYRVSRTQSGLRVMSYNGDFSEEVNLNQNKELTSDQIDKMLTKGATKLVEMLKKNANDIKSGHVTAKNLGGVVFGVSATVIEAAFFPPALGLELLSGITGISFVEAAEHIGGYYGAVVDKLLAVMNGKDKSTISQIVATLATVHVVAKYLPETPAAEKLLEKYLKIDAWSLTESIGNLIGGAAEDSVKTIIDTVDDVLETVVNTPGHVVDKVRDFLGI